MMLNVDLEGGRIYDVTVIAGSANKTAALSDEYSDRYIKLEKMREFSQGISEKAESGEISIETGNGEDADNEIAPASEDYGIALASTGYTVTLNVGSRITYGSYFTNYFTVSYNGSSYSAFCGNPETSTPSGGTHTAYAYSGTGASNMRNVLYYGSGGPGYSTGILAWWNDGGSAYASSLGTSDLAAVTHIVVSYLAGASSWSQGIGYAASMAAIDYMGYLDNNSLSAPGSYTVYYIPAGSGTQPIFWGSSSQPPSYGELKVSKSSTDPTMGALSVYSLEGAVYGVYSSYSNASSDSSRAATLTVGSGGSSDSVSLNPGTYYVKEITAPSGYAIDTETHSVTVSSGGSSTVSSVETPQSDPVYILLEKIDAETGKAIPQGDGSLAGAQYTIKYYDGYWSAQGADPDSLSDPAASGASPVRTWVFQTDTYGQIIFRDDSYCVDSLSNDRYTDSGDQNCIPLGTITIQETLPPDGYIINDTVYVRQILGDGGAAENVYTYNEFTTTDTPIKGVLSVQKIDYMLGKASDHGDTDLSGAEFTIVNASAESAMNAKGSEIPTSGLSGTSVTYAQVLSAASGSAMQVITTGRDGSSSTGASDLPYGTYCVIETKAAIGQKGNAWRLRGCRGCWRGSPKFMVKHSAIEWPRVSLNILKKNITVKYSKGTPEGCPVS